MLAESLGTLLQSVHGILLHTGHLCPRWSTQSIGSKYHAS